MSLVGFLNRSNSTATGQAVIPVSAVDPLPVTGGAGGVFTSQVQFNTVRPIVASGALVPRQSDNEGKAYAVLSGSQSSQGDVLSNGATTTVVVTGTSGGFLGIRPWLYNAATWDRGRTVGGAANTPATGTVSMDNPLWSTSDMQSTAFTVSAAGDNTIIAGIGGQTIRVHRLVMWAAIANAVAIKDGAATNISGTWNMIPGTPAILAFSGRPYFKTSVANALIFNLGAATVVSGFVQYVQSA